jgi:hypothetical protein
MDLDVLQELPAGGPDLQLYLNPALDPGQPTALVYSLRAAVAF